MKYVILRATAGRSLAVELPFIFGNNLVHSIVAKHCAKILEEHKYHDVECVAAGTVDLDVECCGGSSGSTGLPSREEVDARLINALDYTGGVV